MESILSVNDEVYQLKSRGKSLLSSTNTSKPSNMKKNSLNNQNKTNTLSLFYQYIKKMIAKRSIYILGIVNLVLASVAIVCVAQAEDHPEHFSLVYISVSIFIFYMATIIFIIVLQIVETYQEHNQQNRSSSSIQIPLLTPKLPARSNPIIVESMTATTKPKIRLSRSQTLPLTLSLLNPLHSPSTSSSSSSTLKDFNQITSTRLALLPKYHQSAINTPKYYQSFALTTNEHFCPSCTTATNSDSNPQLSPLIKPIPLKKSKLKLSQY